MNDGVAGVNALSWQRMQPGDLSEVMAVENAAYPYPWTRGNFLESLENGYDAYILLLNRVLAGYFVVMNVVDELHLLNITVRPALQGRGFGRMLLDRVSALAREKNMVSILLEVRPSNVRALEIYQRYGYATIGRRKAYYPAGDQGREDAIVMRLTL